MQVSPVLCPLSKLLDLFPIFPQTSPFFAISVFYFSVSNSKTQNRKEIAWICHSTKYQSPCSVSPNLKGKKVAEWTILLSFQA
jgi:hypothetical protein